MTVESILQKFWTKKMWEELEELGLEKVEIEIVVNEIYQKLKEDVPNYLESLSKRTLAIMMFNRILSGAMARNQIRKILFKEAMTVESLPEKNMATLIALRDSKYEMMRIATEIPEEAWEYEDSIIE